MVEGTLKSLGRPPSIFRSVYSAVGEAWKTIGRGLDGSGVARTILVDSTGAQAVYGDITAAQSSDKASYGGTQYSIVSGFLNATVAGNTELVASEAGKKHVILEVFVINLDNATAACKFQSATTDITPTIDLSADGGGGRAFLQFEGSDDEAININNASGGNIAAQVRYITV